MDNYKTSSPRVIPDYCSHKIENIVLMEVEVLLCRQQPVVWSNSGPHQNKPVPDFPSLPDSEDSNQPPGGGGGGGGEGKEVPTGFYPSVDYGDTSRTLVD